MLTRLLFMTLLLLLPTSAQAITVTTVTLQDAAAANGNGTVADVKGYTTAVLQVAGTFSGTVTFQGSVDGSNYVSLECFSLGDRMTAATTATSAGAWRCNLIGLNKLRAPITGYVSGTITVKAGLASAGVT